ncbi:T-cell-specific guanine nucleotide triphosphate-binding protein 2-like isoform X1 [Mya arenaria]|uniref:T-cell-specific guanine nucleotide triphosphate-binding protein 2-like isoform X1 n=1 Tax=Mya arenaria TaxID=6604 RepID=UPI0022DF44D2|nr:T-cell-specific guanine nucleotide triphosphate-binding protein 2-like isoform X1 [Mya arenaria]
MPSHRIKGKMASISEEDEVSFREKGTDGLHSFILQRKENWKSNPLRIAVTGNSGVGKSSLINAFLGLKPNAPGAAAVGITETTMQVKAYPHPNNENFVLYDLPGVGTQLFRRKCYLKKVDFNKYDFFLILSATRFTENEAWLARRANEQQKKFFFVRTKIDIDMENEKDDSGENFNQEKSLQNIKEDVERNLQGLNANVYLITTRLCRINQFECTRLIDDLTESTPQLKTEALVLHLSTLTESVLLEKTKLLSRRSGLLTDTIEALAPVHSCRESIAVNDSYLELEASFYRQQLHLDSNSLGNMRRTYGLDTEKLNLKSRKINFNTQGILDACCPTELREKERGFLKGLTRTVVNVLLPSIATNKRLKRFDATLQNLLNILRTDAMEVNKAIIAEILGT